MNNAADLFRRITGCLLIATGAASVLFGWLTFCLEQPKTAAAQPPEPDVIHVAPELGLTSAARILSIRDGDTLKVEFRFVADIRLLDCWAPELQGKYKKVAEQARANLKRFEGKTCVVQIPLTHENIGKATSLGRVLGRVNVNGDDLGFLQRKAGHAVKTKDEFIERWPEE